MRATTNRHRPQVSRLLAMAVLLASGSLLTGCFTWTDAPVPGDAPANAADAVPACEPQGPATDLAHAAITAACAKLDTPYAWGGGHGSVPGEQDAGGFDCSGLVRYAYWEASGTDLLGGGTALSQWELRSDHTEVTEWSELLPGDLVYYDTAGSRPIDHVGLYLGDGWLIHAQPGSPVSMIHDKTGGFVGGMRIDATGSGSGI